MTTVLKLGGSVITRKTEPETVDDAALDRAAAAVAGAAEPVVLVHGGGSFGHPHADRHGLSPEQGTYDTAAALDVHAAMCRLNDHVIDRLQAHGGEALPVRPLSTAVRDQGDSLSLGTAPIEAMLVAGFFPVLHGDVVVDQGRGVSIVSGDELVVALARTLEVERVGLCSAVPGVMDAEGTVVERVESFDAVADAVTGTDATDVTGGMAAKVRTLLELDAPASVFGLDELDGFLAGGAPGTLISG